MTPIEGLKRNVKGKPAHLGEDLHIVKTFRPVFRNSDTSLRTKRLVYCAMVLGMLIHVYGVKT